MIDYRLIDIVENWHDLDWLQRTPEDELLGTLAFIWIGLGAVIWWFFFRKLVPQIIKDVISKYLVERGYEINPMGVDCMFQLLSLVFGALWIFLGAWIKLYFY